jgi:hypothetical protein
MSGGIGTTDAARVLLFPLNRWRVTGEGPPFVKYGPRLVRYVESVLDDWAQKRLHASTSAA